MGKGATPDVAPTGATSGVAPIHIIYVFFFLNLNWRGHYFRNFGLGLEGSHHRI